MSDQPTGGPAFPEFTGMHPDREGPGYLAECTSGMTLRDYFAAKAMQAMLTNGWQPGSNHDSTLPGIAHKAYEMADALLVKRSIQ
jgi:hypothetical protein